MIFICCKLLDKLAFHSHKILLNFLGSVPNQIYMSKGMCFHSSHFVARDILLLGEVGLTLLSCSNRISICVFIVATHNNNDSRSKCDYSEEYVEGRRSVAVISFPLDPQIQILVPSPLSNQTQLENMSLVCTATFVALWLSKATQKIFAHILIENFDQWLVNF